MPTEIETNPTTVTPRQENQSMSSGGSIYIHAENDYDSLLGYNIYIYIYIYIYVRIYKYIADTYSYIAILYIIAIAI